MTVHGNQWPQQNRTYGAAETPNITTASYPRGRFHAFMQRCFCWALPQVLKTSPARPVACAVSPLLRYADKVSCPHWTQPTCEYHMIKITHRYQLRVSGKIPQISSRNIDESHFYSMLPKAVNLLKPSTLLKTCFSPSLTLTTPGTVALRNLDDTNVHEKSQTPFTSSEILIIHTQKTIYWANLRRLFA